mmetsp:Transcript_61946/g.146713  ORF Transcript_61946/g.146713 Transcript_61946/m.146713 type:complete len:122 (-) Transcript_61946:110-475(-)
MWLKHPIFPRCHRRGCRCVPSRTPNLKHVAVPVFPTVPNQTEPPANSAPFTQRSTSGGCDGDLTPPKSQLTELHDVPLPEYPLLQEYDPAVQLHAFEGVARPTLFTELQGARCCVTVARER